MSALFRALVGTVTQTTENTPEIQIRSTGALIERNEVIKLKYLQLSIDAGGLLNAGLASVFASLEYGGRASPAWELRHDLIITGAGIGETTKEWFLPNDFPEFVSEDVVFTVGCNNIEFDQVLIYKLIYEIRKITDVEMLQHLENFQQFGMG